MREVKGKEIIGTAAVVKGAGDGLSPALSVDPLDLEVGERLLLVLDVEVDGINYPRDKKNRDGVLEKYVLQTLDVAVVTGRTEKAALKRVLIAHRERVQRAIDSMRGQEALDLGAEGLTAGQLADLERAGAAKKRNGNGNGRRGGGPRPVADGVKAAAGKK